MIRPSRLFPLALLAALQGGCGNLAYNAQAVGGHLEVMRAARSIDNLLLDPATDPALNGKLQEVLAIREFASRELGLPDNDSYRQVGFEKDLVAGQQVAALARFGGFHRRHEITGPALSQCRVAL